MGGAMRGDDGICGSLFSYIDLEKRVRADPPLRLIRQIANAALHALSGEFAKLYSPIGRVSIPPERLLRALLLQAFYSIRSERRVKSLATATPFSRPIGTPQRGLVQACPGSEQEGPAHRGVTARV